MSVKAIALIFGAAAVVGIGTYTVMRRTSSREQATTAVPAPPGPAPAGATARPTGTDLRAEAAAVVERVKDIPAQVIERADSAAAAVQDQVGTMSRDAANALVGVQQNGAAAIDQAARKLSELTAPPTAPAPGSFDPRATAGTILGGRKKPAANPAAAPSADSSTPAAAPAAAPAPAQPPTMEPDASTAPEPASEPVRSDGTTEPEAEFIEPEAEADPAAEEPVTPAAEEQSAPEPITP